MGQEGTGIEGRERRDECIRLVDRALSGITPFGNLIDFDNARRRLIDELDNSDFALSRPDSSRNGRVTEEAISDAVDSALNKYKSEPHSIREVMKAELIRALLSGEPTRKWISVDERLPEVAEPIWFGSDYGDYFVKYEGLRTELHEWYSNTVGPINVDPVTHWCPRHVDTSPPFEPTNEGEGR